MNGLPIGECEHHSLLSILVIQEHEFGCGVLWAKIEPLQSIFEHFAQTVGVWFNSSLALQARFLHVEVRDTCNCDVVDYPQLVISVSLLNHSSYPDTNSSRTTSVCNINVPFNSPPLLAFRPLVPRP